MILALLAALAAADPPPLPDGVTHRAAACAALVRKDPAKAVTEANAWRLNGGGMPARQCLGLAYAAQDRWAPAATAFEQAAREAEMMKDANAAHLWVQAGNAALAGGEAAKARNFLDAALAQATLSDPMLGEALLDRARAGVALGDLAGARTDLDRAILLVAADPMAWLLSATLARRQEDVPRAASDIAEAVKRAPDDADVALEAGNIAAISGDLTSARAHWGRAETLAPASPTGRSAHAAILANAVPDDAGGAPAP